MTVPLRVLIALRASQKLEVRSQRCAFRRRIKFLMRKTHHYALGEAARSWGFPP
ncbi:MAG: hypothetical protein F6K20_21775 [Moorea sp. SIO2C4]|nr:hypothetical protein [Moorena sp. SIO2C4]